MNNLLYIYEEVVDLIKEKGLDQYEREDAKDKFIWQFAKNGSSLHVKTVMQSRYVLYATEKDYNLLVKKADEANLGIVLKESKKEVIEKLVSQYEEVSSKAILFIRNGNKGLLQNPDEKKLSHVIYFFTNENLELILDWIKENVIAANKAEEEKKMAASRGYGYRASSGVVSARPVVIQKPKLPELTDEDIKNVIPEGCEVSHQKYGRGTVKAIIEGRIKVLFEDSVEKIFAAQVCIDKKLLTVI
ncbi:hypothetical protein [Butyrivibrio sp. VCD2006]|uniref:hypothetical protein n=1 Tax=Butyrivibrio sp. VCD2006 TaxID=1280664 RepID=UPI00040DE124|nr:hypothetical protein [Butyrivibrio sp. VCD2006]